MVKLERLQSTPYGVSYVQPNGMMLNYTWMGAKGSTRCIVEVEDVVYEWLKYNTSCFQKKKLVVVDKEQKEDIKYVLTDEELEAPVYTVKEVEKILNGSLKEFKVVVASLNEDQVAEFINIAKKIKLDSSSKKAVLAKRLNMPTEIIFDEE